MDWRGWLFNPSGLTPHGFCLSWAPGLIATHVIADTIIGLSYFSIPLAIAAFLRRRTDIRYSWVAYLFVAFILACGTTHFMAIFTLWFPAYGIEALIKIATAILSLLTAAIMWPLVPKLVALPSAGQLSHLNAQLVAQIEVQRETAERLAQSEADLHAANEVLERRVAERTAELLAANSQLETTLAQRDLLLREVYHRVKNNLQMIDSLIVLQSRRLADPAGRDALSALRSRVYALGLVHHQLMGSDDLQTFDIAPFLDVLSRHVVQANSESGIVLSVDSAPLVVGLDFAIPLGLIVTELVTNALKHAFPSGTGRIDVSLRRLDGHTVLLTVADNGKGLPEAAPGTSTLGSTIVRGLVTQLLGSVTLSNENGVRAEVKLPAPGQV